MTFDAEVWDNVVFILLILGVVYYLLGGGR